MARSISPSASSSPRATSLRGIGPTGALAGETRGGEAGSGCELDGEGHALVAGGELDAEGAAGALVLGLDEAGAGGHAREAEVAVGVGARRDAAERDPRAGD